MQLLALLGQGVPADLHPDDQFTLVQGEDRLTEYQFHKHKIRRLFCATCGVQPFAGGRMPDGRRWGGLNVRAMNDVDVAGLAPTRVDGRSF